jgi:hypothetical protein
MANVSTKRPTMDDLREWYVLQLEKVREEYWNKVRRLAKLEYEDEILARYTAKFNEIKAEIELKFGVTLFGLDIKYKEETERIMAALRENGVDDESIERIIGRVNASRPRFHG